MKEPSDPIKQRSCSCGSGLPSTRCCALDPAVLASPEPIEQLDPVVQRASAALDECDTALAETLCLEVLEIAPWREDALALLFRIRLGEKNSDAAETLARRMVLVNPDNIWATTELALLLLEKGKTGPGYEDSLEEGAFFARAAVRIAPRSPQAHSLMAKVLTQAGRPQIGEYHYRRVLELVDEEDPVLLADLAGNLCRQGRMSEARELFQRSIAVRPGRLETLLGWAHLEETDRKLEAAADVLHQAERAAPDNRAVQLLRALLYRRLGEFDQALMVLAEIEHRDPNGLGPHELMEKGESLDRMGRYPEAWAAFAEGKRKARLRMNRGYPAEMLKERARRLQDFFTAARLATLPRAEPAAADPQPLFVLGFARSGTTLVEQMLSAHPCIAPGGELPLIHDLADFTPRLLGSSFSYPEALAELWMGDQRAGLSTLRDLYVQRARQLGVVKDDARWFTDKTLLSEISLGFIGLIFPHAPVIHMIRHPLDVVVSLFSKNINYGYNCSFELETLIHHYLLTVELTEHYRGQMTLRYLPVRYEHVVGYPESSLSRIFGFIGEEFAARCLRIEENTRYAQTVSYAQVREPLYDRSCYRYRNYMAQLEHVVPVLQPIIERLGYSIDGAA